MKHVFRFAVVAVLCAGLQAAAQDESEAQPNVEDFMKALSGVMGGGTNAAASLVDFRDLKALLPKELPGMKRTSASGEKSGAMGFILSTAEGVYEAENGGTVTIKISDNSGMGGFMAMAQAGWGAMEIDKETETGFERTTTYGKNKAHEQYDSGSKSGKVELMVASKFGVDVEGNDVPWEAIEAAVKAIDLEKLAALQPKTAAEPPK